MEKINKQRKEYLNWDQYFMGVAKLSAMRSKDPNTQVGACIVNEENRILSMGYNGMPRCCSDDEYPWDRNESALESKYLYVCHAELNAILNSSTGSVKGIYEYGCELFKKRMECAIMLEAAKTIDEE